MESQLGQLLYSFFLVCQSRKVVFGTWQTNHHTHATVPPVYLWIQCIRIAALTRYQTVFLYEMCAFSLNSGAVRKHVAQAGQRFNLGSLWMFGSQSSSSIEIIIRDFAVKFIRTETKAYFWRDGLTRKRSVILTKCYKSLWFIAQLIEKYNQVPLSDFNKF